MPVRSSFDAEYSFDKEYANAKSKNSQIDQRFETKMRHEVQNAERQMGKNSPEYKQFLRSVVSFASVYTASMKNLDAAFKVLKEKSAE